MFLELVGDRLTVTVRSGQLGHLPLDGWICGDTLIFSIMRHAVIKFEEILESVHEDGKMTNIPSLQSAHLLPAASVKCYTAAGMRALATWPTD